MKFLIIAGHGAGDPGAGGCGLWEADLTREAVPMLRDGLRRYGADVTIYPTTRNCYADIRTGGPKQAFLNYECIIEVHFNAYNGQGHGTETLYKTSKGLATAVTDAVAKLGYTDRGPKLRTDLQNMNYAASLGVPYILIETCFIDNAGDMARYGKNKADVWENVAAAVARFYDMKKRPSKLTLTGENYPEKMRVGSRFVIKGTVHSNVALRSVSVVVEDAKTGTDVKAATKSVRTTAKAYKLSNIDPYIAFRKLPVGKYRYKVKATDANGTKKTLLSKKFEVVK